VKWERVRKLAFDTKGGDPSARDRSGQNRFEQANRCTRLAQLPHNVRKKKLRPTWKGPIFWGREEKQAIAAHNGGAPTQPRGRGGKGYLFKGGEGRIAEDAGGRGLVAGWSLWSVFWCGGKNASSLRSQQVAERKKKTTFGGVQVCDVQSKKEYSPVTFIPHPEVLMGNLEGGGILGGEIRPSLSEKDQGGLPKQRLTKSSAKFPRI